MVVGVCRVSLFFPQCRSLKEKRRGLRRLVDRVRNKFNAAVGEVGDQDAWQRATVGVAVVSTAGDHAQSMVDKIVAFIEQLYLAQILEREVEILHYGEDLSGFTPMEGEL